MELIRGLTRVFLSFLSRVNAKYIMIVRNKLKGCKYNFTLEKIKWLENTEIYVYAATDMATAHGGNYEPYEFNFIKKILKDGDVFIDVGANIGLYAIVAGKLVGEKGKIFAFEPSSREYELLLKNISLNKLGNVKPYKIALSSYDGNAKLKVAGGSRTGANTLSDSFRSKSHVMTENIEEVEVFTIDSFFGKISISKIDLIKIDVEGFDFFVLEGAKNILNKYKPILMLEILEEGLKLAGSSSEQIFDLLELLNYKVLYYTENGSLTDKIPKYVSSPKITCYNIACFPAGYNSKKLYL